MKKNNHIIKKVNDIIVIENVKRNISRTYPFMNKMPTVEYERLVKTNKNIIADMLQLTKGEYLILRLVDMLEKEMQKVHILLRSGKNYVKSLIKNVLNARKKLNLQKTILNHYQKVERIIYQIFNHYVGLVIVENGKLTFTRTQNYSLTNNPMTYQDQTFCASKVKTHTKGEK